MCKAILCSFLPSDIDECMEEEPGCSHDCVNEPGGFQCVCPDGYDIGDDEKTCEDLNECEEDDEYSDFLCSHECVNEIGRLILRLS